MRPTPLQTVKKNFESREKLAAELAGMVDQQNGDSSTDETKARLMGLSNKKLLRLYKVEQKVRERFGDKAKLIDHIIDARKAAGHTADDTYRGKLETYSKARLLDMTKMTYAERAAKQTPEQRLAKKRGRKQRERARSKMSA
ncbi:MAG: hypothetical protein RIT81_29815 [Deltaproteobacteria bacterium]